MLFMAIVFFTYYKAATPTCGPVEEGLPTTLTCEVDTSNCSGDHSVDLDLVRWEANSSQTGNESIQVALCDSSTCSSYFDSGEFSGTITPTNSSLTISSVNRTHPFDMETAWACVGLCNMHRVIACDRLEVYCCTVRLPPAELGEGTHSFQAYIFPPVEGGQNLVDVTQASGTISLYYPKSSHRCLPAAISQGYFPGKLIRCFCTLVSEGYPQGDAEWTSEGWPQALDIDGALHIYSTNAPKQIYQCEGLSPLGRQVGSILEAKFAFFDEDAVIVERSHSTAYLCGSNSTLSSQLVITCRVPRENVSPAPTFSFSLNGQLLVESENGSINAQYFQHKFFPNPGVGGEYQITCSVTNIILNISQYNRVNVSIRGTYFSRLL
ncbi:hypothetical protein ElyMa_002310600 [Elysia marginata]|uniref:Ig-like domain-containing protein n=1 Tax=Elysia marginata TaxID=1093978 RepID=A0AAV4G4H6_9GAST|nr:hypothetical protein ElyMa_002310600 [Elysia marginata]